MKETFAGACAKALTGSAALTAAPNRLKLRKVRLLKAREFEILKNSNNFPLVEQEHHNKEDGKQVHLDANLLKFSRDQVNQNITQ